VDGWERAGFEAAVARAREYIAAGDCYHVVLARRLTADYQGEPFELYRALRRVSPTPYLFFLRFGERALAAFGRHAVRAGQPVGARVVARQPRRKRARVPEWRRGFEARAEGRPQGRSEHVMLVDLGRNDVGRVSQPAR
jgi:anthranilate synthase component 1